MTTLWIRGMTLIAFAASAFGVAGAQQPEETPPTPAQQEPQLVPT